MTLRVGPAGWSYSDWEGTVYPRPKPPRFDPLVYLSEIFDTIEVNSSFYRPPQPRFAESWIRRVAHNPRFRFTLKVWNRLTHETGNFSAEDVALFVEGVAPLIRDDRLGALLLQFPWSFKNDGSGRKKLAHLISVLADYPLVVELRHASWNDPRLFEFLKTQAVGFCNIDQPVIGQSIRPSAIVTAKVGYFRLHGRNYRNWFREAAGRDDRYDYLYTAAELDHLMGLMIEIREASEDFYIITNNHFRGKAVCNGIEIQTRLSDRRGSVPPTILQAYPQLNQIDA